MARWQLIGAGETAGAVRWATRSLHVLQDGVWLTGHAPVTRRQRMWGAALTAPRTVISDASAGAAWGYRPWDLGFEVVTRPGRGGPRRQGSLLVCRSTTLAGSVAFLRGLPITSAERTLCDLWPALGHRQQRKMLREALRLRCLTIASLRAHLAAAAARNRPATLCALLARYERLQLARCRSDAEAYAVELIDDARVPLPAINVRIGGEEADLSWPSQREILEIDGDQFHQDKAEDARKTRVWRAAGWNVRRAESDVVFDDPAGFVARVRQRVSR